ncbi:GNAT family N-acetyltransferase [Xinfangfangia sp. D13-10-4-6]|uniref:GNAT family N-acetyltransferase n=1 Tax=Pseudogemmobacter hezensis TaxID=2737662 RepID=UPI001551DD1A|nr:GNAT family N-acetyltransferase [Pseudogemmobacter hezensis]NPD17249.1 GNAT family N-acetyltransferase [Pseudogemmobacter hezensis]
MDQREEAARIYWQAFGGKLSRVMGPDARALAFLNRGLRPDHCFAAMDWQGRLVGLAGYKSVQGSFSGGTRSDLRRAYGRFGSAWRAGLLRLLSNEVDNERFLIDGIAVSPAARGKGIGTALINALCDEALRRGYREARLEVIDGNPRARALYERQGFVATHTDRLGLLRYAFGFDAATTMIRVLGQPDI